MFFIAYQLFQFITELLLASVIYVRRLPRRRRFPLRLAASVGVCYAVSSLYNRPMSEIISIRILRYFVLFLLLVLMICICFAVSWKDAFFFGLSAYASQHILSKAYRLVSAVWAEKLTAPGQFAVYLLVMFCVYLLLSHMFGKAFTRSDALLLNNNEVLLLGVGILASTIVLDSFAGMVRDGSAISIGELSIRTAYAMLCSFLFLCIQSGMFRNSRLVSEMEEMRHIWEIERRQLEMSKETIDLINVKCHDLKHQLSHLDHAGPREDIEELKKQINIYENVVSSGNEILDVILTEKSLFCESRGIFLSFMGDGSLLNGMKDSDIYSLFGNALDNAIRAVSQLPDEKRTIQLSIQKKVGMLFIQCRNDYDGLLEWNGTIPATTKKDNSGYHGYGIRSMQMIAEKYQGTLSLRTENCRFILDIVLPEHPSP